MKCKDCINYKMCGSKGIAPRNNALFYDKDGIENICDFFKYKLRYIELPCFFGDKVYFPYTGENYPQKLVLLKLNAVNVGEVVRFTTDGYGTHIRVQFRENGCTELTFYADEINKKVFFDKEKAETKLKELNGNGRY